ncbi:MAG: 50S ribosomal protein L15 [Armatimonadetes bacterium]|nr:50S ribosomal protein L15 [Anaerolineae bacterium]
MKLHDLKPAPGSTRKKTRVGRGISAGKGKTAGRGIKGTGARTGGGKGNAFEGGQLPFVRRLPFKRGFTNIFRIEYQEVNLDFLEDLFDAGTEITPELMKAKGLIRDVDAPIVILGRGDLTKKFTVHTYRITKSAEEKIAAVGGAVVKHELKVLGAHATVKKLRKGVVITQGTPKQRKPS